MTLVAILGADRDHNPCQLSSLQKKNSCLVEPHNSYAPVCNVLIIEILFVPIFHDNPLLSCKNVILDLSILFTSSILEIAYRPCAIEFAKIVITAGFLSQTPLVVLRHFPVRHPGAGVLD